MKKVALITLHGMGKENLDYYADLERSLKRRLGSSWSEVSLQTVQYAQILQKPQSIFWRDVILCDENDIDATRARQFFLYGFGDAAALEYSGRTDRLQYLAVQNELQSALRRAYLDLSSRRSKPVVIIAHSLGCQVISNYLWDAARSLNSFAVLDETDTRLLSFLKLKSLRNLVTTGCNIPIFIAGLEKRKCFSKPHPKFRWDNFYDPDDILGWPVRQLDRSFRIATDHPVNVGGLLTSWNVLSHSQYWNDRDVVKPLANTLLTLLA